MFCTLNSCKLFVLLSIAFILASCGTDTNVTTTSQPCIGVNVTCTQINGGKTSTPVSPTQTLIPTVAPTTQPPSNQCNGYDSTGTQATKPLQGIIVANSCVLIIDGYSGTVGGVSWNNGGVIALGPGTYNGSLTDGEWLIVSASIGPSKFCEKVHQLQQLSQADSTNLPLDGANWPSC